jgi:hypothetical protein
MKAFQVCHADIDGKQYRHGSQALQENISGMAGSHYRLALHCIAGHSGRAV